MGYGLGKHYWDVPIEHEVKYITVSKFWTELQTDIYSFANFWKAYDTVWDKLSLVSHDDQDLSPHFVR